MFVAEGEKVVDDLLNSSFTVKKVFGTASFIENRRESSIEWIEVTEAELRKISTLTTPNQVLAVTEIPSYSLDENEIQTSLSLVLDDVSDPGNLGTVIRLADWFGIKNIICSQDTADCYNSKVVQAAMGSLFRIKVHYTELESFFEKNKRAMKVFGTELNGENIYSAELSSTGFIVLGNESKGVRNELKKYFTKTLHIPSFSTMEDNLGVDSLNIAVAAAIVCSEFKRRIL